jgi:hypothetical protein
VEEKDTEKASGAGPWKTTTPEDTLESQLQTLESIDITTHAAILQWDKSAVQMFFSEDHPISDIERKVKELRGIPLNHRHPTIDGRHEDTPLETWPV